jgi:phosphatidate cytidylyltransferase
LRFYTTSVICLIEQSGDMMEGLSRISINLLWVGAAAFTALITGTMLRLATLRSVTGDLAHKRLGSLATWWVIAILIAVVALFGRMAAVLLFAALSGWAFYEFLRLAGLREGNHRAVVSACAAIPVHYLWIALGWRETFLVFLPLWVLIAIVGRLVVAGQTAGFVRTAARIHLGLMLTAYCISHAALLFNLPAESNHVAGVAGWFVFLIILTEFNDIAQALVGRRIGNRKIAPHVSPNKTWEGFLGGVLATTILAVLLAPWLTPLADGPTLEIGQIELAAWYSWPVVAGLLIAIAGFFGDLIISGLKRDVGVKDSGSLLPGQGGILDRVDSLTLTAPVFYYFVYVLF